MDFYKFSGNTVTPGAKNEGLVFEGELFFSGHSYITGVIRYNSLSVHKKNLKGYFFRNEDSDVLTLMQCLNYNDNSSLIFGLTKTRNAGILGNYSGNLVNLKQIATFNPSHSLDQFVENMGNPISLISKDKYVSVHSVVFNVKKV